MKNKKWLLIPIAIILILVIVIALFSDSESKYFKEVDVNTVIEKIDHEDTFMLYIKQTNCDHCKAFTPRFLSVLKQYKLEAYVLNLTDLSDEDKKVYDDKFDVEGTPTVLFFDSGSQSMIRIEGEQTQQRIISKLKSAGYDI